MLELKEYKAVILAGGKGTRLYPITKEIPKPLLPVKGKPIINYLVDLFSSQGIEEIAVLINKDSKKDFDEWKKKYFPENRIKIVEEEKPLGTFGGLYFLKEWIGDSLFFLSNGDELKKIDLIKMAKFHQKMKPLVTLASVKVSRPQDYGVLVIGALGTPEAFIEKPEKPPSNNINSGIYLLSPKIFNYHPGPEFSMIEKDIFPKLVLEKKIKIFETDGKWMDCGTMERYNHAIDSWE